MPDDNAATDQTTDKLQNNCKTNDLVGMGADAQVIDTTQYPRQGSNLQPSASEAGDKTPSQANKPALTSTYATDPTTPSHSPDTVLHSNCKTTAKRNQSVDSTDVADSDLKKVAAAWASLPPAVRAGIVAIAQSASKN